MGPNLLATILNRFQSALYARTEVAGDSVDLWPRILHDIAAPRTIPVLFHKYIKRCGYELATVASLMNTDLTEIANEDLIIIKIVLVLAHIASDLSLITVLLNHDMLVGC